MRIGKLRHRLVFQEKTVPERQDDFGAPIEEWEDAFTVWGAFEPLGGIEFPSSQKRYAQTTARFRIRHRTGIDPDKHRIVFGGQIWDIARGMAQPDGRHIELWIEAKDIK